MEATRSGDARPLPDDPHVLRRLLDEASALSDAFGPIVGRLGEVQSLHADFVRGFEDGPGAEADREWDAALEALRRACGQGDGAYRGSLIFSYITEAERDAFNRALLIQGSLSKMGTQLRHLESKSASGEHDAAIAELNELRDRMISRLRPEHLPLNRLLLATRRVQREVAAKLDQVGRPPSESATPTPERARGPIGLDGQAAMLLTQWQKEGRSRITIAALARELECSRTTLYDTKTCPIFVRLWEDYKLERRRQIPRGRKDRDTGTVEAWHDEDEDD